MSTATYRTINRRDAQRRAAAKRWTEATGQPMPPRFYPVINRNAGKGTQRASWHSLTGIGYDSREAAAAAIDAHIKKTLAWTRDWNTTAHFPPHCWAIVRD